MNIQALASLIVPADHNEMTDWKEIKSSVNECDQGMPLLQLRHKIINTAIVKMRLKTTALRRQKKVQGDSTPEMGQIDFIFKYCGIGRMAPKNKYAGQRRRSALVGFVWEEGDRKQLPIACGLTVGLPVINKLPAGADGTTRQPYSKECHSK